MTEISLMRIEDVEAVHAIEEACFAIPWSRESFLREVTENQCARYLVLREDGVCVAYAGRTTETAGCWPMRACGLCWTRRM